MHCDQNISKTQGSFLGNALLAWYDPHHRRLPWRANPGDVTNPYGVLVSELMLQQTTVSTILRHFPVFMQRWPTIQDLAQATRDEVLHAWQGLGYYRRAHALHNCAIAIVNDHKATIPKELKALTSLPGIGAYTAAALLSIAYDLPYLAVDGNVSRVLGRYFGLRLPLAKLPAYLRQHADLILPPARFGDFTQSMMDLGAQLCTSESPKCLLCPLKTHCIAYQEGSVDQLPIKPIKTTKPLKKTTFFWIENEQGEVLIEKRPDSGLLAGMNGFPSTPWDTLDMSLSSDYLVHHTFTHFILFGRIEKSITTTHEFEGHFFWHAPDRFHELAFPTLMKKVIKVAKSLPTDGQ